MKESYTPKDSSNSSNALASSALTSHENGDSHRASNPLVKQEIPEDDDEPPIRPSYRDYHEKQTSTEKLEEKGEGEDDAPDRTATRVSRVKSHQRDVDNLIIKKRPFDRDPVELAEYLHTSLSSGLDESEAQNRLKRYGKNILKGQGKVTIWTVLWRQVSNAMTVILLGALAIAFATEDYAEGSVIAGIPPLNDI
jgi:magnesium-transporting ATPase (P-type)